MCKSQNKCCDESALNIDELRILTLSFSLHIGIYLNYKAILWFDNHISLDFCLSTVLCFAERLAFCDLHKPDFEHIQHGVKLQGVAVAGDAVF